MFNMPEDVKLLMEHVSFQAYIEIFNKIEEVNIAALVVSSITIIVLAINNEFLKVSAKRVFFVHVLESRLPSTLRSIPIS
jgi:hypothetical protein